MSIDFEFLSKIGWLTEMGIAVLTLKYSDEFGLDESNTFLDF